MPSADKIDANILIRWDATWYMWITESGYSWANDGGPHTVVFFPLYPLLSRFLHVVSGISVPSCMIIVANFAFLIAIIMFFRYVYKEYNEDIAIWSTTFLSMFPTSLFFSAGYPESLSLLFSIATFHFLSKDRLLLASLMAGIATSTRSPLVMLSLPIFLHLIKKRMTINHIIYSLAYLLLSVSGIIAYAAYLYFEFSDPLVFVKGHVGWESANPSVKTASFIKTIFFIPVIEDMKSNLFNLSARTFDSIFFIFFLVSSLWGALRYRNALFIYAFAIVAFSYLTHAKFLLVGMDRYLLLAFPVFILTAEIFKGIAQRVAIVSILATILFMHAAWFAKWYWAG
ncbi:MAG: hypothetical protein HZA06_02235 [Nitrospirae bacterium]|nr:hypothetical protein [Nitrospirota bacterium]